METFLQRIASVWSPHPGQREFLLSGAKTKVLACGRRWGKTDACAVQILFSLTQSSLAKCLLIAPTLEQARILFDRIVELAEQITDFVKERIKPKVSPVPRLTLDGHIITARSGHRLRSLRGFGATEIVVDEAAYVPDALIHEVLWPMMATTGGRMTLIGTPNGRNAFWRMFQRGQGGCPGFWSRQSPTVENPRVVDGFLDLQREMLSEASFAVEYEAAFIDRQGAVFPQACVERCLVTGFENEPRGPYFVGIDFARVNDYTAIAVLSGSEDEACLVHISRFQKDTWQATVDELEGVLRSYPGASVVCDATGGGSGPTETLTGRLKGHHVDAFTFSALSKANLVGRLRTLIERAAIRMKPDEILLRELESYIETPSTYGPSKYGAASGHDDMVTALALAAWKLPKDYGPLLILGGERRF